MILTDTNNLREAVTNFVRIKMGNRTYELLANNLNPASYLGADLGTRLRYLERFEHLITNFEYLDVDEFNDAFPIFGWLEHILTNDCVNLRTLLLRFGTGWIQFGTLKPFHTQFVNIIVGSRNLCAIGLHCTFEETVLPSFWRVGFTSLS